MKVSELTGGKYLKKEDLEGPTLLTIRDVEKKNVALETEPPDKKGVISWVEEDVKPMVLNSTNANEIASLYGEDTDDWRGQKVVLFVDPSVVYAGRRVGGVRVRAPKGVTPIMNQEEEKPPAFKAKDGDVPF